MALNNKVRRTTVNLLFITIFHLIIPARRPSAVGKEDNYLRMRGWYSNGLIMDSKGGNKGNLIRSVCNMAAVPGYHPLLVRHAWFLPGWAPLEGTPQWLARQSFAIEHNSNPGQKIRLESVLKACLE